MNRIVKVAADPQALAQCMAERWCEYSAEILSSKDLFQVALSGGSTPRALYQALASSPVRERLDWNRHEWFFGDERAVPPDHPDSNWRMVYETLFLPASVPLTQCHRMMGEAPDLDGAARAYEQLLAERLPPGPEGFPVFDLILLGLGKDGHTASLFPHTAALHERTRSVVANEVPALNTRRLTITYPVINSARQVWVMATGKEKAATVAKVIGPIPADSGLRNEYPILGIKPEILHWWLDDEAASLL